MTMKTVAGLHDPYQCGSLALVTYLPEPLRSFLTDLRQSLGGENTPEAHITFLPPRSLPLPAETAAAEAGRLLRKVAPFEVELGGIRVFPETNILYIEVASGQAELSLAHSFLNAGTLSAEEQFDFIPHLTLSAPLEQGITQSKLAMAQDAWKKSTLPRRFRVNEVVLLWQLGGCSENDWARWSSFHLTTQT